ncbi:MAG: DUF4249 domain-containing protein [Lewinellaceae bacterium]|nr:DUF4249 domain-containing protein [Lewinellaceae bacterium]
MKNSSFLLLFFAALLVLIHTGCNEDSFSQVVEIDIPQHQPLTVLNGHFSTSDKTFSLLVSSSRGILDTAAFGLPKNAAVTLLKDGVPVTDFSWKEESFKYASTSFTGFGQTGALYRLEVSVPGMPPAYAEQTMPAPVEIQRAEVKPDGAISADGDRVDGLTVDIKDPAGVENYYAVQLLVRDTVVSPPDTFAYEYRVFLDTNDPLVSYAENQLLIFSDASFEGKTASLNFYSYDQLDRQKMVLRLYALTREGYLYLRSKEDYENANGNPFAEPVTVFSNVEGGYGIFMVSAATEKIINP